MPYRSDWRDCQAWRDEGLPFSTTSNEAVKLYDAALTQMMTFHDDPAMGGLGKTIENMLEADPNFVMGRVLAVGGRLAGAEIPNPEIHPEIRSEIETLLTMAAAQNLTEREKKHVAALEKLADGQSLEACKIYEEILLDHPEDLRAVHSAFFTYFFAGEEAALRDSLARIVPRCRRSMPLYSYLYGLWGFGYVETNMFEYGEKLCRQGLEMNPNDSWAVHAVTHALDHTCRHDEGISFLTTTRSDWEESSHLACHNNWHMALLHIEKGDNDSAVEIYDQKVEMHNSTMFNVVDRASLLRRLELQGVDVGGRWSDVYELARSHLDDHCSVFQQVHCVLAHLGSKHTVEVKNFLNDIHDVLSKLSSHNSYRQMSEEVGLPLYQGLLAYEEEDYAGAVNLLQPLKYKVAKIGGSNAQRDIFDQILISAALLSPDPRHSRIPSTLLYERKALRGTSNMTEALMTKALQKHEES